LSEHGFQDIIAIDHQTMPRPVIAIDGSESIEGRASYTLSALSWCAAWLPRVDLKMIDIVDENIFLALDVFQWEHGIAIGRHAPDSPDSSLSGADLYVAAAFRSADHLRLPEARDARVPTMLAIQFPNANWYSAQALLRHAAAFDPRIFAAELKAIVRPWF